MLWEPFCDKTTQVHLLFMMSAQEKPLSVRCQDVKMIQILHRVLGHWPVCQLAHFVTRTLVSSVSLRILHTHFFTQYEHLLSQQSDKRCLEMPRCGKLRIEPLS